MNIVLIGLGAILGALSRYFISMFMNQNVLTGGFPYGTFIVNLVGAFTIGLFLAFSQKYNWDIKITLFVVVGFLGSFTTFSAYIFELATYLKQGFYTIALQYFLLSNILGTILALLAYSLFRK